MTIQNTDGVGTGSSSSIVQNQEMNVVQNQTNGASSSVNAAGGQGQDFVQLSNASNLVELAKGTMPADKTAKFDAVSAQIQAGDYHPSISSLSQALVQGHVAG